jgi:hypothetical protein
MLVFQPLQSGGRDVVLERRPRCLRPRSSEWPLFSHLPICHGIDFVYLRMTQSRKFRLGPDNSSHSERDARGLDVE